MLLLLAVLYDVLCLLPEGDPVLLLRSAALVHEALGVQLQLDWGVLQELREVWIVTVDGLASVLKPALAKYIYEVGLWMLALVVPREPPLVAVEQPAADPAELVEPALEFYAEVIILFE